MKKMLKYLLPLLLLFAMTGAPVRAENLNKARLNALIQEIRGDENVEVVDIGSFGMKMMRTAARAAAKTPEDREVLRFLKGVKGIKVVNFEGMEEKDRIRFAARVEKVLAGQEKLMEAKSDGKKVDIYASTDEKGEAFRDVIMFDGDGALICLFGTIPFGLIENMVGENK